MLDVANIASLGIKLLHFTSTDLLLRYHIYLITIDMSPKLSRQSFLRFQKIYFVNTLSVSDIVLSLMFLDSSHLFLSEWLVMLGEENADFVTVFVIICVCLKTNILFIFFNMVQGILKVS